MTYGRIFEIAISGHETWSKAKVPEVAHTLSFTTRGSKLSLFSLYEPRFPRYWPIFKIAIFGHETWPLTKDPEVVHILFFYLRGSKLSLFSLYVQRFPRYWPIIKIAIFGHETWPKFQLPKPLTKVPVAHIISFYPGLQEAVSDMELIWKLTIFGHETWPLVKVPEIAQTLSFYSRGVEIEVIFALRIAVSEIRADFQNCHNWAWHFAIGQSSRRCTCTP